MKSGFIVVAALAAVFVSCKKDLPVYNVENEVFRAYLEETVYHEDDHESSTIENYYELPTDYKKDRPAPVTIKWKTPGAQTVLVSERRNRKRHPLFVFNLEEPADSVNVWNLIPGRKYYYSVKGEKQMIAMGAFLVEGPRRMIYVDDVVRNVRDLGGLPTYDGRTIRYGLLYRGAQMDGREAKTITEEGKTFMREFLGVKADLDLRNDYELYLNDEDPANDIASSPLGTDIAYSHVPTSGIDNILKMKNIDVAYRVVLSSLREGKPVFFHCVGGADRTGFLAMMIELSVGVRSEDALKDYETTSFSKFGIRARNNDCCQAKKGFEKFYAMEGLTMTEKAWLYLLSHGVTQEEIDEMKELILI